MVNPTRSRAELRGLDYLAAHHVMGWASRGEHPIHCCPVFATGQHDTLAPFFSTDPEAAWRLVLKLREEGGPVFQVFMDRLNGMADAEGCPRDALIQWAGMPYAVTVAALSAKGIQGVA